MELAKENFDKVNLIFERGIVRVPLKPASHKIKAVFIEGLSKISETEKQARINDVVANALKGADMADFANEEQMQKESQKAIFDAMKNGELDMKELFASTGKNQILERDNIYLELFKIIIDTKDLTTADKEEMLTADFWENQDTEVIEQSVDFFRSKFKLENY